MKRAHAPRGSLRPKHGLPIKRMFVLTSIHIPAKGRFEGFQLPAMRGR